MAKLGPKLCFSAEITSTNLRPDLLLLQVSPGGRRGQGERLAAFEVDVKQPGRRVGVHQKEDSPLEDLEQCGFFG